MNHTSVRYTADIFHILEREREREREKVEREVCSSINALEHMPDHGTSCQTKCR